ncbi:MAG: class I SAM-dependent methyltransferase [Candidatus Baltobacteraceae bacterium]
MANAGRAAGRRFDRRYGTTTEALLFPSQLDGGAKGEAYAHATHYEPVPIDSFRSLLACVPEGFLPGATFVDVGSGMGRAVLLASEYPFKQIVGIELAPALHAIATENVANARGLELRCRDLRLLCGDARRRRFPKGDLVVFLFNPFDEIVLRETLERIVSSRARGAGVIVLYHTPVHRDVLAEYASDTLADSPGEFAVRMAL